MEALKYEVYSFLIYLPAILIALTFHEYAHGRVADWLGDDTPYYQGRLTINPLAHIDWLGFIIMLFPPHFGWGKPVQVNPYKFKNISAKRGMMLVSLAGPTMNILLAFVTILALHYLQFDFSTYEYKGNYPEMIQILFPLIQLNILLAVFNLIPLPPLDGSKILAGFLSDRSAQTYYSLEPYGPLILLLLIFTNMLWKIIYPLIDIIYNLLIRIVS